MSKEAFFQEYERQLARAVTERPSEYADSIRHVPAHAVTGTVASRPVGFAGGHPRAPRLEGGVAAACSAAVGFKHPQHAPTETGTKRQTTQRRHTMMIPTKYIGPTNHKGERVQVTLGDGRKVYVPWDYALNPGPMHAKAAAHAIAKMGVRGGAFVLADMPTGTRYSCAVVEVAHEGPLVVRNVWGDVLAGGAE